MKKLIIILAVILAVLGIAGVTAYQMIGIYVDPPIKDKSDGSTLVYYRRLVKTPFLFSADSVALQNGATPSDATRTAVSRNVNEKLARFKIMSFAFNKYLYLKTTDNRDFIKKDTKDGDSKDTVK